MPLDELTQALHHTEPGLLMRKPAPELAPGKPRRCRIPVSYALFGIG